jgi:hypothetical protein
VLVDWLPWNHTFGGNKNFNMTIYNGGTLYIDDGKPTPQGIAETLRAQPGMDILSATVDPVLAGQEAVTGIVTIFGVGRESSDVSILYHSIRIDPRFLQTF